MDESDESYEPILPDDMDPPKRAAVPPPLPRMWKTPAEPDDEEPVSSTKAKKKVEEPAPPPKKVKAPKPLFISKKDKKKEPVIDDGTGAVKLEETPVLDTYEARQRARWLIGGLGLAIVIIFGLIIRSAVKSDDIPDVREGEPPGLQVVSTTPSDGEVEARVMLENARKANDRGNTQAALNLLNRVSKTYPNTAGGREALAAIDRHRKELPLFGTDAAQAAGPKKVQETGPKLVASGSPPPPSSTGPSPNPNAPTADVARPPDLAPKPQVAATPEPPQIQIRPLPSGYRPNYEAPIHPSGWPTRIFADEDGGELVLVPGGTFDMGRVDGEPQEGPVHRVRLSTYYIDLHEVTVRQYSLFLKSSGRSLEAIKKMSVKGADPAKLDDYPIVNVSAKEAKAFCDWAKRSLPTEAQWEMAARSTSGRISFWNEQLPRPDPEKGGRVMEPVKSLDSDVSAYGAFDLGANAWEWTSEFYDSQYYKQFRNLVIDPAGPEKSRSSIAVVTVKGGSKKGILTWREGIKPETRLPYLGFRGALSVEFSAPAPTTTKNGSPPPTGAPPNRGGVQPF